MLEKFLNSDIMRDVGGGFSVLGSTKQLRGPRKLAGPVSSGVPDRIKVKVCPRRVLWSPSTSDSNSETATLHSDRIPCSLGLAGPHKFAPQVTYVELLFFLWTMLVEVKYNSFSIQRRSIVLILPADSVLMQFELVRYIYTSALGIAKR